MEVLTALGDAENDLYSANFADYSGGGGTKVSRLGDTFFMHVLPRVSTPWRVSYNLSQPHPLGPQMMRVHSVTLCCFYTRATWIISLRMPCTNTRFFQL